MRVKRIANCPSSHPKFHRAYANGEGGTKNSWLHTVPDDGERRWTVKTSELKKIHLALGGFLNARIHLCETIRIRLRDAEFAYGMGRTVTGTGGSASHVHTSGFDKLKFQLGMCDTASHFLRSNCFLTCWNLVITYREISLVGNPQK